MPFVQMEAGLLTVISEYLGLRYIWSTRGKWTQSTEPTTEPPRPIFYENVCVISSTCFNCRMPLCTATPRKWFTEILSRKIFFLDWKASWR